MLRDHAPKDALNDARHNGGEEVALVEREACKVRSHDSCVVVAAGRVTTHSNAAPDARTASSVPFEAEDVKHRGRQARS